MSETNKQSEWDKAKAIEKLHLEDKLAEYEIMMRTRVSKVELRRRLKALALANLYIESDYGDQFKDSMFPLFLEAVSNTALKDWLGWNDAKKTAANDANRELFFSWLSREPSESEDESELAGSEGAYLSPVIMKRDDIRSLSTILKDERAFEYLRITRDLAGAVRSSITTKLLCEMIRMTRGSVDKSSGAGFSGVEQTNVFSDRIGSHFSSITIESYKVFKNLCLDKLARINLVAGLNNSGKTSLLEAVYLLARQNDFDGILGVIQRRGKITEDRIQAEWLVNQIARPIAIKGVFDGKQADVTISVIQESNASLDMSKYLKSVEIVSNFDDHKQESMTRIFKGQERVSLADSIKLLCNAIYSSPFFMNEPLHYSTSYQKSVRSKFLPKIFDFIRQEIAPTISDIRLVEDPQRFLVTDSRFDETPDLTSYGDGLQRIFFISLLFASAQNGILLIDEFENAIHVDLMAKFAPFVYKLAIEFNVQVFLTSHSKECIDSFVQNIDNKEDISFHAMVPTSEGAIVVRGFEGQKYSNLLRIAGIDLRKAQ